MKQLILILSVGLLSCEATDSCKALYKNRSDGSYKEFSAGWIYTVEQDSCEYVIWDGGQAGGIIHKQNCNFCKLRNR